MILAAHGKQRQKGGEVLSRLEALKRKRDFRNSFKRVLVKKPYGFERRQMSWGKKA